MTRLVAVLLLLEPLRFAVEALRVLPTIGYRGTLAVLELIAHALVAGLATAGAFALINQSPAAARIASIAVFACVARTLQSLYWTMLPSDAVPGQRVMTAVVALSIGGFCLLLIRRAQPSR